MTHEYLRYDLYMSKYSIKARISVFTWKLTAFSNHRINRWNKIFLWKHKQDKYLDTLKTPFMLLILYVHVGGGGTFFISSSTFYFWFTMLRISGKLLVFKIGYTLDQKILIKCICTAKILQHLVEYCIKSTCVSNADVFIKRGLDSNFF